VQTSDNNQILTNVANRYTALADSSNSCCGEGENGYANNSPEYDTEELSLLIPTVTEVSAGCGNPLTISSIRLNETVVDLGSGGGIDCFLASKQTGPNGKVYGVDMTPAMINLANKNKAKLGIKNVEFIKNQIDQTNLPSESVDVILSNCVINLVPDKTKVFEEAFRILKTQGRLQICDIVLSENLPDEALTDEILIGWEKIQDEEGAEIPFNEENKKLLLQVASTFEKDANAKGIKISTRKRCLSFTWYV